MFEGLTDFQTFCICFFGMLSIFSISISFGYVVNCICEAINHKNEEQESYEEYDDDEKNDSCEECSGTLSGYKESCITLNEPTDAQIDKIIEDANKPVHNGFKETKITITNPTPEQIEKLSGQKEN